MTRHILSVHADSTKQAARRAGHKVQTCVMATRQMMCYGIRHLPVVSHRGWWLG